MPLAQYTRNAETVRAAREVTTISYGETEFNIRDQKGRTVGYKWSISAVKVRLLTETERSERNMWHGHLVARPLEYFQVWGTPTRDGRGYGPAFNTFDVETLAEAEKLVSKRIEAARKSNAKKFGEG